MEQRRRVLLAMLAVGALAYAAPKDIRAQARQPSARDVALQTLASHLHLPLLDEATEIFSRQLRRAVPSDFVRAIGQSLSLGAQWRRGDPTFDEAVRQVEASLAIEEARAGPLLKIDRSDLLYAVDVPWSESDIAFVEQTLDTDLGREAERALDAKAAQQAIATLQRQIAVGAPSAASFAELDMRAQSQFGDAFLTLLAMRATDPQRAQRLQRLVEAVSLAPSDAIGERVARRLSQRMLDAASARLPNLLGVLASFRLGS